MEEDRVIGSFHFRLASSGNLIGEYINNHSTTILTESANRENPIAFSRNNKPTFEGNYVTSWLEGNRAQSNRINIDRIQNSNVLNVIWTTIRGEITFQGKAAFMDDNNIYGYYSGNPFILENN